jgi:hypothetical protein
MVPKFKIKLPSSGKEVTYRPFLVKEEKALLMAVEAGDQETIIMAVKDAITACVENIDVSKLPYFDVEYLFLHLRAKSIGEIVKFNYRHAHGVNRAGVECKAATEVEVNIDDVEVKRIEGHTHKFMIDDKYGLVMRYPTIDTIRQFAAKNINEIEIMASCIDSVYDADNVYPAETLAEAVDFIQNMNPKQYEKLSKFFETMPKLQHEIEYKCVGCGQVDKVKLDGVSSFF